jgi:hypothetical protein
MAPNKRLLEEGEDGVSLRHAWWVYADLPKKKRFRELQQTASPGDSAPHMGFRHALEDEVIGRLSSGELQAFGIEYGSTTGPIAIPKNYFWKGAKIDFDNDTVASLGRKFGQVTVQGKREPIAEALPEMVAVDPQQIQTELKVLGKFPAEPELTDGPSVAYESETSRIPPPSPTAPHEFIEEAQRGRPTKTAEIEQAIDILLTKGVDLAGLPRPKAYKAVRQCAASELGSDINVGFSDPVIQRALFRRLGRRR